MTLLGTLGVDFVWTQECQRAFDNTYGLHQCHCVRINYKVIIYLISKMGD